MFETRSRTSESNVMGKIIAGVAVVAVLGGGYVYWNLDKLEKKKEMKAELTGVLGSGSHTTLQDTVQRGMALSDGSDKDLADLVTAGRWVLYGTHGIEVGGALDPAALDAVTLESPLPLVIARGERDLLRRDLQRGTAFIKKAQDKFDKEPVLAEMLGRYKLAETAVDPGEAEDAVAAFFLAMNTLGTAPAEAIKSSKPVISAGYAIASGLAGNQEGAVNNIKDAAASAPDMPYLTVLSEMWQIPGETDFTEADNKIKQLIDANKDKMSPRQLATVQYERGRRALTSMNVAQAYEPLQAAAQADPTFVDASYALGQLYLDNGKLGEALKHLEAAEKVAPFDQRVLTAHATALILKGDAAGAQALFSALPEPYNDGTWARIIKARAQRESGTITDAPQLIAGVLEFKKDLFEAKLEQALLKRAQKAKDAEKAVNDLQAKVIQAGRYAFPPVLRAYSAGFAKKGAPAYEQAAGLAEAEQNALAFVVLAESMVEKGDKAGAEKMLAQAKQFGGDLPKIDSLLGQVAVK